MKKIPVLFGEIASYEGYVEAEIVEECVQLQKLYRNPTKIGEILEGKGLLTSEQVAHILNRQIFYKTILQNEYFANLILKKKLLPVKQLRDVRKKFFEEAANGNWLTLAHLAVKNQSLPKPIVEELLKSPEFQYILRLKKQGKATLDGYELVGNITKMRRAVLFKALQIELDRLVAIKVLGREYETEEQIKKFFTEAKTTARFNHPNLVRVYDTGICDNGYYYAMELVEGDNLVQQLETAGRFQVGEAVPIIRQIAKALAHIHSYDMVHGEVSPRNIAIREDGVAKLLDLSSSFKIKPEKSSSGKPKKMPQYMAPEQVKANELLNVKTDIYCLGATFYRMLTGHPPVGGKSIEEICHNVLETDPTPMQEIDFTIPEDLSKIVHRMIRKDPAKRYKEIKNVLFALRKILI